MDALSVGNILTSTTKGKPQRSTGCSGEPGLPAPSPAGALRRCCWLQTSRARGRAGPAAKGPPPGPAGHTAATTHAQPWACPLQNGSQGREGPCVGAWQGQGQIPLPHIPAARGHRHPGPPRRSKGTLSALPKDPVSHSCACAEEVREATGVSKNVSPCPRTPATPGSRERWR